MESIKGTKLDKLPFDDIKKVSDLIYFDGPILSHFKDSRGNDILFYWVDYDEKAHRWAVFSVNNHDLQSYLSGDISLLDILQKEDRTVYFVDIDGDCNYFNFIMANVADMPDCYKPDQRSFYFTHNPSPEDKTTQP